MVEGELPVDHVRPQDAELRVLREAEEHRHRELLPRLVEQQLPHRVRLRTLGMHSVVSWIFINFVTSARLLLVIVITLLNWVTLGTTCCEISRQHCLASLNEAAAPPAVPGGSPGEGEDVLHHDAVERRGAPHANLGINIERSSARNNEVGERFLFRVP